jgi:hypothetical protein
MPTGRAAAANATITDHGAIDSEKISVESLKGVSSLVRKVRRRPRIWPMATECRPSVVDMADGGH